jgi:hypothetical protein
LKVSGRIRDEESEEQRTLYDKELLIYRATAHKIVRAAKSDCDELAMQLEQTVSH